VSIKDSQHPDRGGDRETRGVRPHQVLEIGAGPADHDLGLPLDPGLVTVTKTDLKPVMPAGLDPPRVVRELDATGELPADLVGRFDTVWINNARHYTPNLPQLARALVPGGRIIVQGRARTVGNQTSGVNEEFDAMYTQALKAVEKANPGWSAKDGIQQPDLDPNAQLPKNPPPPNPGEWPGGLQVSIDLMSRSPKTDSAHVAGSGFNRTGGTPSGGGPNARLVFWVKDPKEPVGSGQ
jgi:SAM-dependent methyltransferase